ncbi:MAG: tetratricopeptide repeat protein [Proteobacteria bacterium]|nr:MAG: tetratricopeptide repeat protein [Pseudomonadota bacterium]
MANPDLASPWRVKAQVYLARDGVDKKAYQHALDAYTSFVERNPTDPTGYFDLYSLYMKLGNYERAQFELERIQSYYPKYPNLHLYKGIMYSTMGNYRAAVPEFEVEIKQNEQHLQAYLGLGKAQLEMRDFESAAKNLQMAMRLNPKSSEAKFYSAMTNQRLKNFVGAIALFKTALDLDPGNPLLYKRMGECYREMGETQAMRAAFKKYLQMEPDAPDRREIERL